MDKYHKLNIENLDKKFKSCHLSERPNNGWIKAIRTTILMPSSYLAKKLNISQQAISGFEKSEIDETISIGKLRQVAEALGCTLHYVLIPEGKSLKKIIDKQAYKKACLIVNEVDKSMTLENQKVNDKNQSIKSLAKELAANPNFKLWEDND